MPKGETAGSNVGGVPSERLRSYVDRIKDLEEQRQALAEDVKDVLREATAAQFSAKVIRRIVKDEMKTPEEQKKAEDELALYEIYRASLGTLGDTPLGSAALRRLAPQPKAEPGQPPEEGAAAPSPAATSAPPADPLPAAPTPQDVLRAQAEGAVAAKAGKPVLSNPYPAMGALRAAWDQGWCAAQGSDGMDIPDAFRRPKKPGKGASSSAPGGEGGEA